jgi:predicted transcriptional regulator
VALAVKISAARKELKERYGLSLQEVRSNLTYLISEGWVEEQQVQKSVPLKTGTIIPQVTPFYRITARGIDKIEGPSEYTMKKFHDIKIEATGQNIITLGDGNQVNVKYQEAAGAWPNFAKQSRPAASPKRPSWT